MATKKTRFPCRCKFNEFRDQETEMDKVSWGISAQYKSQEHDNDLQEARVESSETGQLTRKS